MLKLSILSIGDEVCIGQITNTNAQWIAQKCVELGCKIMFHLTAEDDKQSIVESLDFLSEKSDYVLITGGLGPTHDDITKKVLTEYFGDELIFNQEAYNQMEIIFAKRNRVVTERNKEQALLPATCKIIKNEVGTASGMQFQKGKTTFISMPGVPIEMKTMMKKYILKSIETKVRENSPEITKYRILNTSGITETDLADLIGNVGEFLKNDDSLAFLPSASGVKLRIGTIAPLKEAEDRIDEMEIYIRQRAGKFIYSIGTEPIAKIIMNIMKGRQLTLSVAESCTGGLLGGEITSLSGSSAIFKGGEIVYSNDAKIERLQVSEATLNKFGAVSRETALELAENVRRNFNTDFGISITGIAGPDGGSEDKPVGTVWIGFADKSHSFANKYYFGYDRNSNRERAVFSALNILYKYLNETTN